MIKFTADGDRMAIYIKIKQNSASVGSLGWANTGKQLLIEGESQAHRAKIQAVVEDVAARRKLKKSRSLVRAGAQAWVDAAPGNSMTVLLDAHTPSLSRVNLADLPFAILKHAYWRPQALGLRKDNVDGKAEKRRRCRLLKAGRSETAAGSFCHRPCGRAYTDRQTGKYSERGFRRR